MIVGIIWFLEVDVEMSLHEGAEIEPTPENVFRLSRSGSLFKNHSTFRDVFVENSVLVCSFGKALCPPVSCLCFGNNKNNNNEFYFDCRLPTSHGTTVSLKQRKKVTATASFFVRFFIQKKGEKVFQMMQQLQQI